MLLIIMLAIWYNNPSPLVLMINSINCIINNIQVIRIIRSGLWRYLALGKQCHAYKEWYEQNIQKKEGYTVNDIKMSLFPAYKSFLFCNFAI